MQAYWRGAGTTGGVIYVCRDQDGRERVNRVAEQTGLIATGGRGLRIELLETIKRQTIEACERARTDRGSAVTVDAREAAIG